MGDIVQTEFDGLAARTLDATISPIQYQESRRFFYAGVLWALTEVERVADWRDDPSGEHAALYLERIRTECVEFGQRVAAGQA
jgi:hypothetical protein